MPSLTRPFQRKALAGLLLYPIPIANWIAHGYKLRCIRTAPIQQLPDWSDFKELFIHGLIFKLIQLTYAAPSLLLFAFLLRTTQTPLSASLGLVGKLLIALGATAVLAVLFAPATILAFAQTLSLKSSFLYTPRILLTRGYWKSWALAGGYAFLVLAGLAAAIYLVARLAPASPLTVVLIILGVPALLWLSSITYWTIIGKFSS